MADTEQKVAEDVTANQVEEVAEEPEVGSVDQSYVWRSINIVIS